MQRWAAGLALSLGLAGAAQAALHLRSGGMIYDSTHNITWLSDMNYAKTSGHDVDGRMTWAAAVQWADGLVYGGYDDWRLPTLDPSDTSCSESVDPGGGFPLQYFGFNCTGGSELGGLFITDLGNKAGQSVLNQSGDSPEQIANLALFSNAQLGGYWSGTAYAPLPADAAWQFGAFGGDQHAFDTDREFFAVAVRTGDVAAAAPEPQTFALALLALGTTVLVRRRRPR